MKIIFLQLAHSIRQAFNNIMISLFRWIPIKSCLPGIILCTLSACAAAPANHREDAWFSQDKYAHFVLSGLTSAVIANAAKKDGRDNCDAAFIGLGITLSLGAAKESYDKRYKKTLYSFQDMSWNLLGSTIGSLAGSNCH